jgi:HNH endonuclease
MDSIARFFPPGLAAFLRIRDRWCRTKYCGARIRHGDHVVQSADGGRSDEPNGQCLCELCNHAKQADGWTARPRPGPRHTVETRTPTGHTYTTVADPV